MADKFAATAQEKRIMLPGPDAMPLPLFVPRALSDLMESGLRL